MHDRELETLVADLEAELVERKASATDREKICQAICAFANDLPGHGRPGVIFIGVDDDGACANLPVSDSLLSTLADMRSNGNIHLFPSMSVERRVLRGCELAVITVQPSDFPPVRYKGRTWIRVGPRRAIATVEEERRLTEKRRSKTLPFDIWPIPSAGLRDLDLDLFTRTYLPAALPSEVIEQNKRSIEQQLTSLRFGFMEEELRPTVLGILVSGREPRQFVPGAYVQFLRLDGTQLTDPIKHQKEIGGPLPDLLRMLDETFEAHISVASDLASASIERRRPDYPLVALQQLARNGVMHRTYEGTNAPVRISWFTDRVEIQSPGGAFGQVNSGNFGHPGITDYRNPNLAEAMKNLGYVQRFGVGIQLARKALQDNGNPPPEFVVENAHVLAVLRAHR